MKTIPENIIAPKLVITGAGKVQTLLEHCRTFGNQGMLVHGKSFKQNGLLQKIINQAKPEDILVWEHTGGEPTLDQIEAMLSSARRRTINWVAAIGGGSVIDAAKTCAGLLNAPLSVQEYHDGSAIPPSTVPFIAVPTTAGTGSEATSVCVLTNTKTTVKKSIRHPSFLPKIVILDPQLLRTCPKEIIASAGMDALTQAIESYVSIGANAATDELAEEAIRLIADNIEAVYSKQTGDCEMNLLLGSYYAGVALANARLGLVHGIAHPLGALYHQPHGLVCAVCLTYVLEFNRSVIGKKYETISRLVGGDAIERTTILNEKLGIKNPFRGKRILKHDLIISEGLASGSTKSNPRPASPDDIDAILNKIF